MAHALLAPSSASRWLECTPSARLEADFPDSAGDAADEGTLAHKLGELLIKQYLKRINKTGFDRSFKSISANKFYSDGMLEYMEQYCVYVIEQYNEMLEEDPTTEIFLEVNIDLTEYIPEGFGTGDVAIINSIKCKVIDLKYGKGIKVESKENKQMMLYALGVIKMYEMLYSPTVISMVIYQPRIDNISPWQVATEWLLQWADEQLKVKAQQAWEGIGEFVPGSHCNFCKIKQTCKANANHQLALAAYEFSEPVFLTDFELADIFTRAASFINWINSIKRYMLLEALKGKDWPSLKVVGGKSRRFITDPVAVQKLLKKKGWIDSAYLSTPELLGIGALEKNMGKAVFNKTLSNFIDKKEGAPALVDINDARPKYHSSIEAAKLFEQFDNEETDI